MRAVKGIPNAYITTSSGRRLSWNGPTRNDNMGGVSAFVDIVPNTISIAENGGQVVYTVRVRDASNQPLLVATGQSLQVNLSWSGTALMSTDYTSPPSQVTITAGNSQTTFTLTAIDNPIDEPDKTIIASISSVIDSGSFSSASVGNDGSVVTIVDDDVPVVNAFVDLVPGATSISENAGQVTYTARVRDSSNNPILVPVGQSLAFNASWGGTAPSADYTGEPSSVTISAGQSQVIFTLTAVDNTNADGDRTIIGTIGAVTNDAGFTSVTVGTDGQVVTIQDDDVLSYSDLVLADNPVAYWRLEEPTGTGKQDSSGNGFTLTPGASITQAAGQIGFGASFQPNAGSFLREIANNTPLARPINSATFNCWLFLRSLPASSAYIYEQSHDPSGEVEYRIRVMSTGAINFRAFPGGNHTSTGVISTATWTMVSVVINGGQISFYFNGVLDSSTPYTAYSGSTTMNRAGMGTNLVQPNSNNSSIDAVIDETSLHASPLSAARLLEYFNAG